MKPALILHGGAGASSPDLAEVRRAGLRRAFEAGWSVLVQNGAALEAVVQAVVEMENEPAFNAGVGSCLTQDGTVEVDASLMNGSTFQAGGVGAVRNIRNPIRLAKAVLEAGRHVFLTGEGAQRFARERGFPLASQAELVTERQFQRWQSMQTQSQGVGEPGTVGAVALDRTGCLAAATSTGGVLNKHVGRVGDSAVIGAGTYADSLLGACSATGDGEVILRVALAKTAVELLGAGRDPGWAASIAIERLRQRTGGEAGLILLDALGRLGYAYNTPAMSVALFSGEKLIIQD